MTPEQQLIHLLRASIARREASAEATVQAKEWIAGDNTEAAVRHLFAVTSHLVRTQDEDLKLIVALLEHITGISVSRLRLVENDV